MKLKWSQNSLRTEIELHKESATKVEQLTKQLSELTSEVDKTKRDAHESIKNFYHSQENRAHVLGKFERCFFPSNIFIVLFDRSTIKGTAGNFNS